MNNVTQVTDLAEIETDLEVVDYVAGRLGASESEAFEARMAGDPDLKARVDAEIELSAAIVNSAGSEAPRAGAFDAIAHELDDRGASRAADWRTLAVAASVLAAAAVLVFSQIRSPEAEKDFELLSSDGAQVVVEANRVRLLFAEGLTADAREAVALELGFRIVSGPGQGGAFVVETESALPREQLLGWRDDPRIELAEPIRYDVDP